MYDDFDMMAEQHLYPWLDDYSLDASEESFYDEDYEDEDEDYDEYEEYSYGRSIERVDDYM
jgi:hypothetical protein